MTLKKKLTLGLGFLFIIIFTLSIFCSYYIEKLSREAGNILQDNYNSIVYSRNMILALEDIRTAMINSIFNPSEDKKLSGYQQQLFEAAKVEFEKNMRAESVNITEIHEKDYVETLRKEYDRYMSICRQMASATGSHPDYFNEFQLTFEKLKQAIGNINDLNMQAVVRKSQKAKDDSAKFITYMAIIGTFCIILAFGYFWYFPYYISNTIAYLSGRIKELLKKMDIEFDYQTSDEAFIILQAINLLENKFALKNKNKN